MFQGSLKSVSRRFQECFKEVSKKFQERVNEGDFFPVGHLSPTILLRIQRFPPVEGYAMHLYRGKSYVHHCIQYQLRTGEVFNIFSSSNFKLENFFIFQKV